MKINKLLTFNNTSPKFIVFIILIVFAGIITWLAINPLSIKITSTDPENNENTIGLRHPISFTLSSSISEEKLSEIIIITNPISEGVITKTNNNLITYTPNQSWQAKSTYQVSISGGNIEPYSFQFNTTDFTSFGSILSQLKLPNRSDKKPIRETSDPFTNLINNLPYYGDKFMIQYARWSNSIYITITDIDIETTKQKAFEWLKTQGFSNPEQDLNIRYNIPRTNQYE